MTGLFDPDRVVTVGTGIFDPIDPTPHFKPPLVPECANEDRVCHDHCACPLVPSNDSKAARRWLAHFSELREPSE